MAFIKFWKEIAIGGLLIVTLVGWNVLMQRNDTIDALEKQIVALNATVAADNKWVAAQTEALKTVIDSQNQGIKQVIDRINHSSSEVAAKVDRTRAENAARVAKLNATIESLPDATTCTIMMENLIRNGQAVPW